MIRILLGIVGAVIFGIGSWAAFLATPHMASAGGFVGGLFNYSYWALGTLFAGLAILQFLPMALGKKALLEKTY